MDTSPSWLTKDSDCEKTKVNLSHWNMIDIKINRGCFIAKLTLNPPKCWIKQLQVDIQKNLCVCELLRVNLMHCLEDFGGPCLLVSRSCVVSLASRLRASSLPVCRGCHRAQQADACCFPCRSMHMDIRVWPLNKGLRPVKRASLLTGRRKGHLSAVTNSLSLVTFIIVPFISLCRHFPALKHPSGWQSVTPIGCTAAAFTCS